MAGIATADMHNRLGGGDARVSPMNEMLVAEIGQATNALTQIGFGCRCMGFQAIQSGLIQEYGGTDKGYWCPEMWKQSRDEIHPVLKQGPPDSAESNSIGPTHHGGEC